MKIFYCYLILIFFGLTGLLQAEKEINTISFSDIENSYLNISSRWFFKSGDDARWAKPEYEIADWKYLNESLQKVSPDTIGWNGTGWFRKSISIDSSLFGKIVGINVWQTGAMELYINSKLQFEMGKVGDELTEERTLDYFPKAVQFSYDSLQVLAIRYSNHSPEEYERVGFNFGVFLGLTELDYSIMRRFENIVDRIQFRTVFMVVPAILMVIHLFLFWFEKKQIQNLYYVFFLFSFIAFIFVTYQSIYLTSLDTFFFIRKFVFAALGFTIYFGALTIYSIYKKPAKYFIWLFGLGLIISVLGYFFSTMPVVLAGYAYILATSILGSWILYSPKYKKPNGGEKIIQYGFFAMAAAGTYQMILSFNIIDPLFGINMPYIYGVFAFLLSMSLSLARDIAITGKNLERQLLNVKELNEKTLKQELEAKEKETERRILEADNERKTIELEEARTVQLAMLPQCSNNFNEVDVCFFMRPATEVGGDYYDFFEANDGTLNIAVGDATGHGMKAGIMVATIKSLFSALGANLMIPDFFKKCTEIIKSMSLGNLFMSMTVIRIKNGNVIGSAAGMPPMLHYKKENNCVEEILMKSMPLGAVKNFPYDLFNVEVNTGDVLLLLSDGFPELFNKEKEMLGYDRMKDIFLKYVDLTSDGIVDALTKEADDWAEGHMQEDDITFVAIKIK